MQKISFYISSVFIFFIGILPFRIAYMLSDFFYFLVYYVIGYRKSVVLLNLRNSFPEYTEEEIQKTAKKFFHHLCDLMIETLKIRYISKETFQKRFIFKNPELLERFYDEQKSVILVFGHYGNWEYVTAHHYNAKQDNTLVIYRPLQNKYFDRFMRKVRTKSGCILVPMNEIYRKIIEHVKTSGEIICTAFISDQRPHRKAHFWTKSLHQDTAFFLGPEKIAQKLNQPVVFIDIQKVKRGYYEAEFIVLHENPKESKENEITLLHVRKLEKIIRKKPEHWLWSHKRWKHKPPEGMVIH